MRVSIKVEGVRNSGKTFAINQMLAGLRERFEVSRVVKGEGGEVETRVFELKRKPSELQQIRKRADDALDYLFGPRS